MGDNCQYTRYNVVGVLRKNTTFIFMCMTVVWETTINTQDIKRSDLRKDTTFYIMCMTVVWETTVNHE